MEEPKKRQKAQEINVSQEFSAIIKKGKGTPPALVVNSKAFYEHQLGKFKDGEKVTLIITNRFAKRTSQQNRYLWGAIYPMVAQETGEDDLDRLHELFKGMFLTTGIPEVNVGDKKHRVRMTKSTTQLSTKDFSEFVRKICREVSCIAPPTENWGLQKI